MLKMTTDILTMTSNDRHIVTQTDCKDELTGLDQQYNRTKTIDKEEKRKSPHFAFLKISTTAHLAHLQSRTKPTRPAKALQKSLLSHPQDTTTLMISFV